MAYHTFMAELEALEQAPQLPSYKEKYGASDEVLYAQLRLALEARKPASDCKPVLRADKRDAAIEDTEAIFAADDALLAHRVALQPTETANEPRQRVTRHPSADSSLGLSQASTETANEPRERLSQASFSELAAHAAPASTEATGVSDPTHEMHLFRRDMPTKRSSKVGHCSFKRRESSEYVAVQECGSSSACDDTSNHLSGSFGRTNRSPSDSKVQKGGILRSVKSHVSFHSSVDFEKELVADDRQRLVS
ncbi:hypothetical protein T484DRAFT_1852041 [Baffinella frigidus]|nr:hypothetical protein T484DRAFT_1852041 [Cryptophyta sp. CCMP2293]